MNTPSENNEVYLNWLESQEKVECFTCSKLIKRQSDEIRQVCDQCTEELTKKYAKHQTEEIQFI